jgi:hypothetical protein
MPVYCERQGDRQERDREQGIICDQTVALSDFYSQLKYPLHPRRIRFKGTEMGKTLILLTNLFGPAELTKLQQIAASRNQALSATVHQIIIDKLQAQLFSNGE